MATSLSPFLVTFYMELIETYALKTFPLKRRFWGRFMNDVFSVFDHGDASLNPFLTHLNILDSIVLFTLLLEYNHTLAFQDLIIFNKSLSLEFSIYRKPTHNDSYFNQSPCVKRGVVISLVDLIII